MLVHRRTSAALAAVLSLLVSWTSGPGAVLCMPRLTAERPAASHTAHASHAGHGGGGHGSHAERGAPAPERGLPDRSPVSDVPECPLAVMGGASCLAPVAAPAGRGWRPFDLAGILDYPPAPHVRDQLLAAALFRPPQA
ncbi:MAG TPA: hypothetical protein VEW03_16440 [Longimicrobiaceae bacterium]|nr:hypothetical protein [Longimicrobiaceae bacterium]